MEVVVLEINKDDRRISLGHKQLEENPWEVFETIFGEGSVHQGTILEMKDKAAIVALPYGVEGVCPAKHTKKAEGGNAKVEDTLDFKVIEFNKDAKKIVVSHLATYEEVVDDKSPKKKGTEGGGSTSQAVKALNQSQEKSTLGDLDVLAKMKEEMEKGE
jgi:small subunit ribosomal protein S1